VALSSCEDEYTAGAMALCQGVCLGRFLAEFKGSEVDSITLKIDNMFAIRLSKNSVFHDHSKHEDTRYHYIRQCIEEDRVQVEAVGTNEQLANILMKSLGCDRFVELCTKTGIANTQKVSKA
jgi:hypothetical protein